MFGNLGAFVNGNMFMGLFGSDVGIKLPDDDQQRLLAEPGTGPFGPQERPMAGYVTIPANWPADTADDWTADHWPTSPACRRRSPRRRRSGHQRLNGARQRSRWSGGWAAGGQCGGFGLHVAGQVVNVGEQGGIGDEPEVQGVGE